MAHFPMRIQELAAKSNGIPIAFREDDKVIVIVFQDGRKLTFKKDQVTNGSQHNGMQTVLHSEVGLPVLPPGPGDPAPPRVSIARGGIEPPSGIPGARAAGKKSQRKEKKADG